jgi:hypothetical protein
MKKIICLSTIISTILVISSCQKFGAKPPGNIEFAKGMRNEGLQTLLTWNNAGLQAWARFAFAADPAPMPESRFYAITNLAMHDALNSIRPKYKTYASAVKYPGNVSIDAAIATAAHDAMKGTYASTTAYVDSLLQVSLSAIPDGVSKQKGIEAGKAAAAAILATRIDDGAANASLVPFIQGTLPGEYRSTPPFDGPPFNGFADVPGWGNVKPFGLTNGSQFRVVPPYAINSVEYTNDFNDVKSLGSATSVTRTADQTQIAVFWLESAPATFNRIALTLIASKNLDAWKAARLLALVAMAEADANIGCFDGKYFYHFWRPVTAIRLGDTDGNSSTAGDLSWEVLAPPTPPVPDYPSNHSVNGGAGAEVLQNFFGTDEISFDATSLTLPGVTRHYNSFSQAAIDNALSRVYVGYHFRNACTKGIEQGHKIGKYIFDNYLKED